MAEATFENFVIIDNVEDIEFYIYSYITLDINGVMKHFLISVLPIEDDLIDVIDFQDFMNAKMHLINGCLYNIPDDGGAIQTIWCLGSNGGGTGTTSGGASTSGGDGWVYTDIDGDGDCIRQKIFLNTSGQYILVTEYNVPCPPGMGDTPDDGTNGSTDPSDENDGNWDDWDLDDGHFPYNGNLGGTGAGGSGTPSNGEPAVGALPSIDQNEITKTPKEEVLECLNEVVLTPEQLEWLNNADNESTINKMASMIENIGCETMINIILDYINESPPISEDFRDHTEEILNCIELQNLLDNPFFTGAISALTSDVDDSDQENEKGYDMYNNNGSVSITPVPFDKTGPTYTGYTLNSNSFGGIHMHQKNGLFPMFSPEDIVNLYNFYQIYNRYNYHQHQVVHVLVTPQEVYALKINDLSQLGVFVTQLDDETTSDEIALKIQDYMYKGYNQHTGEIQNATKHQKKFLEFSTQDYPSGVSLYQLNFDSTWSWTKKTYDGPHNPLIDENCN
ncbi:hypothetical protein [Xanthomarina sp. F2636L]|uniref:hypothetical protein n=1 Tax=Xanthomarina sp. F2636L TaxID=2996018 RepID=UPI00225DE04E|nr:hypothetical protein [Xanthomarina sp. F2636L]MCX7551610.1 hypothetical protein [Xanthomarina sp. F2636L]